jgi:hypothetical protein
MVIMFLLDHMDELTFSGLEVDVEQVIHGHICRNEFGTSEESLKI